VTQRLGKAAVTGLAKGNEIAPKEPQKDQRELEKEHSKPLDMGI